jgi:glutathione synthase/RimK-type ligase-like ATP-grasp enzyme
MRSETVLLVDDLRKVPRDVGGRRIVPVIQYLTAPEWRDARRVRVVNLCDDTAYHSPGYYASLLAEARGHSVLPGVRTLQDLSRKTLYGPEIPEMKLDLDDVVRAGAGIPDDDPVPERFTFRVHFGTTPIEALAPLARALFEAFPVPVLNVRLRRRARWRVEWVRVVGWPRVPEEESAFFATALETYLGRRRRRRATPRPARFDVAILHDPEEALAPSNRQALARFIRAGRALGMDVELITARDLPRLPEYDALFIRETTGVDHHTYRFARRAAAEGLVVIDDPDSILRCTNKIYLAEVLARKGIPSPKSVVMAPGDLSRAADELGFPMILKVPDGSFSRGVFKVEDRAALERRAGELFAASGLLLAQAYTFTSFDWRVGILAGEPLFVCRYHMSRGHWQIMDHSRKGHAGEGAVDSLPVEEAPPLVVQTALRAAAEMGDGLYGVDLKQTPEGVLVIEVNDNPNIDAGVEDTVLGAELYRRIMLEFQRRLEERTRAR